MFVYAYLVRVNCLGIEVSDPRLPSLSPSLGAHEKQPSPLLQVVGGMTWCITTCSFDVDVDLLFQENSTIGQKM